mmetsp:Transcript_13668/g.38499  ORF Transcript_13668/g.38499 Transcript_13668/m.38499 type:complete len:491 (-) Transcript_13668:42-1514(-)
MYTLGPLSRRHQPPQDPEEQGKAREEHHGDDGDLEGPVPPLDLPGLREGHVVLLQHPDAVGGEDLGQKLVEDGVQNNRQNEEQESAVKGPRHLHQRLDVPLVPLRERCEGFVQAVVPGVVHVVSLQARFEHPHVFERTVHAQAKVRLYGVDAVPHADRLWPVKRILCVLEQWQLLVPLGRKVGERPLRHDVVKLGEVGLEELLGLLCRVRALDGLVVGLVKCHADAFALHRGQNLQRHVRPPLRVGREVEVPLPLPGVPADVVIQRDGLVHPGVLIRPGLDLELRELGLVQGPGHDAVEAVGAHKERGPHHLPALQGDLWTPARPGHRVHRDAVGDFYLLVPLAVLQKDCREPVPLNAYRLVNLLCYFRAQSDRRVALLVPGHSAEVLRAEPLDVAERADRVQELLATTADPEVVRPLRGVAVDRVGRHRRRGEAVHNLDPTPTLLRQHYRSSQARRPPPDHEGVREGLVAAAIGSGRRRRHRRLSQDRR